MNERKQRIEDFLDALTKTIDAENAPTNGRPLGYVAIVFDLHDSEDLLAGGLGACMSNAPRRVVAEMLRAQADAVEDELDRRKKAAQGH